MHEVVQTAETAVFIQEDGVADASFCLCHKRDLRAGISGIDPAFHEGDGAGGCIEITVKVVGDGSVDRDDDLRTLTTDRDRGFPFAFDIDQAVLSDIGFRPQVAGLRITAGAGIGAVKVLLFGRADILRGAVVMLCGADMGIAPRADGMFIALLTAGRAGLDRADGSHGAAVLVVARAQRGSAIGAFLMVLVADTAVFAAIVAIIVTLDRRGRCCGRFGKCRRHRWGRCRA